MSFEATKREWSELYLFFRLISDGLIHVAGDKNKDEGSWPVARIQREEDGITHYIIAGEYVHVRSEKLSKSMLRERFTLAADKLLNALKTAPEDNVVSPDGIEELLDELMIHNIEAPTTDRTDLSVACWHADAPAMGFTVYSCFGKIKPLLDGGRTANLKFELTGVKLPAPTVNKINGIDSANEVYDRMMMIERMGGTLKYIAVTDKVFRCNLSMIDLHFPRLLAEMLRAMYLNGSTRIKELTEEMIELNPLKIKDDLIQKHHFYEYKVQQFLTTLALGMRPAKIYDGTNTAIEGMLWIDGEGKITCHHKSGKTLEEFLYTHTRFEKGPVEKDKYGMIERENGSHYFKLNARIGLVKR